jgi:hypothetical protein
VDVEIIAPLLPQFSPTAQKYLNPIFAGILADLHQAINISEEPLQYTQAIGHGLLLAGYK